MRRFLVFSSIFMALLAAVYLPAQEGDSLDWDIDTIFDEPLPASPPEEAKTTVKNLIKQRGYTFGVSYAFITGISPGWWVVPWDSGWNKEDYYLDRGIKLQGSFSLDAQFSETFRAISTISYEIPNFGFALGDFFFDYNFYDKVFFRGGKYGLSWGISPNYGFTNLLSRVPKEGYSGESYILKADMPIGIGGVQVLALTRADLMHGYKPKMEDFGFGGKYNLALRWADFDIGLYHKNNMPLRSFLSIKTTVGKTELYNEWLVVMDFQNSSELSGAANFGFARDFFDNKLRMAGELFFNAEGNAYWYRPETNLQKSEISPFIEGFNMAFHLSYRPWEKGNPRLFVQTRYAPEQKSAQIVPGFSLNPWSNFEFSFVVPMVLGSKDGYYYTNSTRDDQGRPLPFSVAVLLTLRGTVQSWHNN